MRIKVEILVGHGGASKSQQARCLSGVCSHDKTREQSQIFNLAGEYINWQVLFREKQYLVFRNQHCEQHILLLKTVKRQQKAFAS